MRRPDRGVALAAATAAAEGASAPAHPAFTVVICAYTSARWQELANAIESIRRQSLPAAEIVLVLDYDDLLAERARRAFPDVCVVANECSKGLAGARNTGIRHAHGQVVAFLDDDARADPRWLESLAPWYTDPRVVGVGGVVTPDFEAEEPAWLPRELHWVIGGTHRGGPAGVGPVRNPFGSNMSFRREVLDEVGGFTPTLGRGGSAHLCCEETELSIRVAQRRSGSVLLHVPDAVVTHSVPPARTTWGYLIRRSWIEGRSKAMVAHNVGSASGLRTERAYVARVLPAGVARGLRDAVLGDVDGLRRAAAIVAALATTVLGYACGVLEAREPG